MAEKSEAVNTNPFAPISDFWYRVRFTDLQPGCRCPTYAQAEWQQFWDTHIEGDRLATTHPDDAYLLCSLGARLANEQGDIPTALQRTLRWFDHPYWHQIDKHTQDFMIWQSATYFLMLGNEGSGFSRLRELLERRQKYYRFPLLSTRGALQEYSEQQPPDQQASDELVAISIEVLEYFAGTKRRVKRLRPGITHAEVHAVLKSIYPSRPDDESDGTTAAVSP